MVAVDGSASSKQALAEAEGRAGRRRTRQRRVCGGQVGAVHLRGPFRSARTGRGDPRRRAQGAARSRADHRAGRREGRAELVETESIGEDIAERLQRYVKEGGIDLAVVGTHGRRGIRRVLLGSVERFVRGSKCPVLLIRGDDHDVAAAAAAA
ncbi:universal stress protein [Burkholderia sp. HI4860]|uniref:universal stress protein n=1 Tax=Burkholderia sp. HI4860 TaxID=2015361 RepID=UPI001F604527|nr:universal stress protein [Burkholderia sp. HI4860]MCI3974965.1 universal stress protein [Burkholderia sp. HI4860]